jgi:hypothetical protein
MAHRLSAKKIGSGLGKITPGSDLVSKRLFIDRIRSRKDYSWIGSGLEKIIPGSGPVLERLFLVRIRTRKDYSWIGSGLEKLIPGSDPVSERLFLHRIHVTAPADVVPGPVAEETVRVGDEDG